LNTSYDVICNYFPINIKNALRLLDEKNKEKVNEIRLRVNRAISLVFSDRINYLSHDGSLNLLPDNSKSVIIRKNDIDYIVSALSKFSVHSCRREFKSGFFSLTRGIRVGVAGTYSEFENGIIKQVNSLNFRIAREVVGCADEIYNKLFLNSAKSVLICGGVNSGKTTFLRDLCRLCSDRYKVTLIDERSELAAISDGIPTHNIGIQTDVIEGCKRSDGIISAIRSLSPKMIFCDEISTSDDAEAILNGYGCGVNFASTIHAGSFDELLKRPIARSLIEAGVFDYAIIMKGENMPGKIHEVRRMC